MQPTHVTIIMDGNGRWATQRGLPRSEGHVAGSESVRACCRAALEAAREGITLNQFVSDAVEKRLRAI